MAIPFYIGILSCLMSLGAGHLLHKHYIAKNESKEDSLLALVDE